MGSSLSEPFDVATEHQGHSTFVRLYGELDLASTERFEEVTASLERKGLRRVVLDLRGLTFIDSSGLRSVIELWKRSQEDGFDLTIVRGGPCIARVIELTGLEDILVTVDDRSPLPSPARFRREAPVSAHHHV